LRVKKRVPQVATEAAMKGQSGDVVCLSIIDWDFRFQRPQQLMTRFADAGRRVLYVRRGDGPIVEKRAGIYELSAKDLDVAPDAIVIVQHPSWWPVAKRLGRPIVYDCMDDHAGFTTEVADADERALMSGAALVVVSSSALERKVLKYAANVLLLRNACDYDHFAATPRAGGPRPVIGYYGAISDWFDVELVAALAARRPDWDLLLIGATYGANVLPLTALPNVTMPGEQPYEELPRWLGVMDVAIIPFRRIALTEATNPVKVYEMLAAGKPVVSVPIPEVVVLAPLVRLASDVDAFEREIDAALREDDDAAIDARRAFAREQTWAQRYTVLAAAIDRLRGE
jgi:glycosyltransferase involved in cell wall biosynthesis